jgi:hypothetical protein
LVGSGIDLRHYLLCLRVSMLLPRYFHTSFLYSTAGRASQAFRLSGFPAFRLSGFPAFPFPFSLLICGPPSA